MKNITFAIAQVLSLLLASANADGSTFDPSLNPPIA